MGSAAAWPSLAGSVGSVCVDFCVFLCTTPWAVPALPFLGVWLCSCCQGSAPRCIFPISCSIFSPTTAFTYHNLVPRTRAHMLCLPCRLYTRSPLCRCYSCGNLNQPRHSRAVCTGPDKAAACRRCGRVLLVAHESPPRSTDAKHSPDKSGKEAVS